MDRDAPKGRDGEQEGASLADGYYRYPVPRGDRVIFVCESDLWTVPAAGGQATRLGALKAPPVGPRVSPDGRTVVFAGREEGGEDVYAMPVDGGPVRRVTFIGSTAQPAGWLPDGRLVVASDALSPFVRSLLLLAVSLDGGEPQALPYGRGTSISFGDGGAVAIARRNFREYAYWKRYHGGTAGQIWIDPDGGGRFRRLSGLAGDQESPMWLGGRLYFLSAHEGVGNLYSCDAGGGDVRRHTDHVEYYARNAQTDGRTIAYHAGGDLYLFDPEAGESRRLAVRFPGAAPQRSRRYVDAARYLQGYDLHPEGHTLALTSRGKPFVMGDWEGPAVQLGQAQGVHYRLPRFLPDGQRVALVSDEGDDEAIEVRGADGASVRRIAQGELGRVYELAVSPVGDAAAVTNQRDEILFVDLESGRVHSADRSGHGRITGLSWAPDGRFLAYAWPDSAKTTAIRLFDRREGKARTITRPVLQDYAPTFDPKGRYLYFLSARVYDPSYDTLQFAMSFQRGTRPYLITLRKDLENPFLATPRPLVEDGPAAAGAPAPADGGHHGPAPLEIDFDGIEDRVLAVPVAEGRYDQIGAGEEKLYLLSMPIRGELADDAAADDRDAKGEIWTYDLKEHVGELWVSGVSEFRLTASGKTLAYRSGDRLRVVRAGEKPDDGHKGDASSEPGRKTGWLDLGRAKVSVEPSAEWAQMLREAWRNMRDHFWTADMSGVDWPAVYERYAALLPRVGAREELFDLIWEMQGELGTSHAYVMSTDPPEGPRYPVGHLGAEFAFDEKVGGYRLSRTVQGDTWNQEQDSPLRAPGVNVAAGDVLVAVNGRRLDAAFTPEAALVHQAGAEVRLTFAGPGGERSVTVVALRSETPARYREWVEHNRAYVHEVSGGRVGYVHVPNMMAQGYAEFHRGFRTESEREALLVDVRYNGGGHVSQMLIERLRRVIIGYDVPRWSPPSSYPADAVRGPIVCLTNECAGSDGDIFSQAFKSYGLGPLIGTRTWGGVIGISGERSLVDGTVTTQPEFSYWFADKGWGVENHGVDPDIVVEEPPMDYGRGKDAQLERAAAECLRLLEGRGGAPVPDFGPRPRLTLPTSLPPR